MTALRDTSIIKPRIFGFFMIFSLTDFLRPLYNFGCAFAIAFITFVAYSSFFSRKNAPMKVKPRPDMPWIEKEDEEDPEFLDFIRRYRTESRPRVLELLRQYGDREIHVFACRSEADAFLECL